MVSATNGGGTQKYRVVLSHKLHEDGMQMLEAQAVVSILNKTSLAITSDDIAEQDGVIIRIGTIDRKTILNAETLKVIGRPGVGVDNVDVDAATRAGVPVVITPNANALSVAEHTITLLLTLAKDVLYCDRELRNGDFDARNRYRAFEIQGKTIGIVGFGRIGKEVARLCFALGMKVVIYDPLISLNEVNSLGYEERGSLDTLLGESDVVSLHVPLTDQTRNLISENELNQIKKGALLLNCSRGGIVDEEALFRALTDGRLSGAGLDVFAQERPQKTNKLLSLENVVATPHMAAQTREAASRMARMVSGGVIAVIKGERWPYVANPKAYEHQRWRAHE